MIIGTDHIGMAVSDLEAGIKLYRDTLGLDFGGIEEVEGQRVRVAFFRAGDTRIELLESTDEDGPIARHIASRGEGIHHIAFLVRDIDEALLFLSKKGMRLIDRDPVEGAHGMRVAFLHPKSTSGVLIEICQKPDC